MSYYNYFINKSSNSNNSQVRATLQHSGSNLDIEKVYGFYPENYCDPKMYRPLGLTSPMSDDKRYSVSMLSKSILIVVYINCAAII